MYSTVRATDPPVAPGAPDPTRRRLSAREREIALLIGAGRKDIVIARRLGLSSSTVRTHVRNMQFRLSLATRAELVAWVAARYTPDHPEDGLRRGPDRITPT
jgi:DNA-binding CsgD family transcriptional regulator